METEGLLPRLLLPATCSYPEPYQSKTSKYTHTVLYFTLSGEVSIATLLIPPFINILYAVRTIVTFVLSMINILFHEMFVSV